MKRGAMIAAVALIAALMAVLLAGRFGAFSGTPPTDLGVREGKLKAPSLTDNSVSSQAALHAASAPPASARINPFPFQGNAEASMARLRSVLETTEGLRIVQAAPDYLRAEATTRWLGFVDDLEFWVDPVDGVIHLRSASRLGARDFGANRRRIDGIRARYMGLGAKPD
jgi:uncharacterized protein (DUF1499 family)